MSRNFNNRSGEHRPRMSGAEFRFRRIMYDLRKIDRRTVSVEDGKDIAYLIHDIETYGFKFIPNAYVWDSVNALGDLVARLGKGGS